MSRTKKEEIPQWAKSGHKKPVTRREFLAHGLIPFAASAFMPNWMRLLSPEAAMAADACPAGGSNLIPFMQLNLEGGYGSSANYVAMDAGRQLLPSYDILGLGTQPVVTRVFNNAPFAGNGVSKVLQGITTTVQPSVMTNTAFLGIPSQARDDSRENYFAINGLTYKAGLIGTKLPSMGNRDTNSGINQMPALFSPPAPLIVKSYNDVANSLSYTAGLAALNQAQKEKLTKLIGDLNNSQAKKLAAINQGSTFQELLNCVGIKNNELIQQGAAAVDPRSNAAVAAVWGLAANTNVGSENFVLGTMAYNTILGQAGSASYSKGGYDYHGNARATTDTADLNAGILIGKILETARVLNKPICLMVTSDGAVSFDRSTTATSNANSDRGSGCVAFMFMYMPSGMPVTTDFQIGQMTAGQSADAGFITGGSPEMATQAVFLNWLKLNKRMDLYSQVVPTGRGMDAATIDKVVKVG